MNALHFFLETRTTRFSPRILSVTRLGFGVGRSEKAGSENKNGDGRLKNYLSLGATISQKSYRDKLRSVSKEKVSDDRSFVDRKSVSSESSNDSKFP